MKEINQNYFNQLSLERSVNQVKSLVKPLDNTFTIKDWHLWLASEDSGVALNRGRRGAALGPKVLLHHFGLMQKNKKIQSSLQFSHTAPQSLKNILHLGAGHDQVYHLLEFALSQNKKEFLIINLDAHADMRKDKILHSGTPFRYFYEQNKNKIKSYQIEQWGLSPYYQNADDLVLEGASIECLWQNEINQKAIKEKLQELKKTLKQKKDLFLLVSFDADVVSASLMPAVSAVNATGLKPTLVRKTISMIKDELKDFEPTLGIYEYNPLYDTNSGLGAKYLSSIIYDWIF